MIEKKPYGCLTIPGLATALAVILVVVGVGVVKGGILFSPGPLNAQAAASLGGAASHADLSNNCSTCHAFFWQAGATMSDRCMACHTDVATQQQDPGTLHGSQFKKSPGLTCRSCHPDHRGPTASLTDLSMADFSHDSFGYDLTAHQLQADGTAFTCKTCHVSGYTTFDQAVCTTCHQQIKPEFMQAHLQAYGATCLGCHDGIDTYGHNFNHANAAFQLTGKHAQVDCGGCHSVARSIADLKSTPRECAACHEKDDHHNGQFGTACQACHTTSGWLPPTFDHASSNFPLTGAHESTACTKCHINNIYTALPITCDSCHTGPASHVGLLEGRPCQQCHTTVAWLPATFDHSTTKFSLTGAHVSLACALCHTNGSFTGLSSVCASCHVEPATHAGFQGMPCEQCHTTTAWIPSTFNHARTTFPLTGAHASLSCARCHINGALAGLPTACAGCHANPAFHAGLFTGMACSQCHSTSAWVPASFNLAHPASCGAVTCVGHEGASCLDCHTSNLSTATCLKCHDTNNPTGDGGGGN